MPTMKAKEKLQGWGQVPLVRQTLFIVGVLLILVSPAVGVIPGPGGVVVFALGLGLVLKYSDWAKRQYVRFKRRHPNKGRWSDWGLRRESAKRREERLKALEAEGTAAGD
jgi:hypothetical protein